MKKNYSMRFFLMDEERMYRRGKILLIVMVVLEVIFSVIEFFATFNFEKNSAIYQPRMTIRGRRYGWVSGIFIRYALAGYSLVHLLWKGGTFERYFYLLSAVLSILFAVANPAVPMEAKLLCGIFFAVRGIFCLLLFRCRSIEVYLKTREYEEL